MCDVAKATSDIFQSCQLYYLFDKITECVITTKAKSLDHMNPVCTRRILSSLYNLSIQPRSHSFCIDATACLKPFMNSSTYGSKLTKYVKQIEMIRYKRGASARVCIACPSIQTKKNCDMDIYGFVFNNDSRIILI